MKLSLRIAAALFASVAVLTSCGSGPALDEVRARVCEAVRDSASLNTVLYGEGLPVNKESYTGYDYYYVDIEKSDYDSIDELKAAIAEIYTSDYCRALDESMFVGISDSIGSVLPRFREEDGVFMQDKYASSILPGEREFDFDGMTMEKSSKNSFTVRIPATLDGKKDADAVLTFRLETDSEGKPVWKLDSPTY